MKAKIEDKKEIAEGTLWLRYNLQGNKIDFKAGQYFYIDLIDPPYSDAKGNSRHFSLVNPPKDNTVIEMATRITGSAFKKSLAEMPIGTEVEIRGVDGNFTMPENFDRPLVFITGGIGITPFISIVRDVVVRKLERKIILLYSNRNAEGTAFLDELRQVTTDNPNIELILTMTEMLDFEGEKRLIDADFIAQYAPNYEDSLFMFSGPPAMVKAIRIELKKLKISNNNIKFEEFVGY